MLASVKENEVDRKVWGWPKRLFLPSKVLIPNPSPGGEGLKVLSFGEDLGEAVLFGRSRKKFRKCLTQTF